MKFRVNRAGIEAMECERFMHKAMAEPARTVLRQAVTHAPFRTGAYRTSLKVQTVRSGPAVAYVTSDDSKAGMLEYGTGHPFPSPHFETLTRATERAGFKRFVRVPHVRKGARGRG